MRIDYLDGLRGLAILLVIGFHAYSRWSTIVPYGDAYALFPLFKLGWLGVQLFFLISGFVIFMTLDKISTFKVFIYKRWLRLFPAMLVSSILIFLTLPLFSERPAGHPQLLDLVPGLTFIQPNWWSKVLGINVTSLEPAFWSLYVEFKFYIIAGAIYYSLGRRYLVPSLIFLFFISILDSVNSAPDGSFILIILHKISEYLSLQFFGWFAAGSIFYLYHHSREEKWFILAVFISILSALFVRDLSIYPTLAALIISAIFAISLKSSMIQTILENRVLLFFGLISYPLYLIHENSMISLIIKMPTYFSWIPQFVYPFIAISILSLVAYLIASKYEVFIRNKIHTTSSFIRKAK